jgi:hypothetical protein
MSAMKIKIGTVMDEEVARRLKEASARDGRPFSDLLQEAAVHYLNQRPLTHDHRMQSVERFCSRPFELKKSDIRKILDEEAAET